MAKSKSVPAHRKPEEINQEYAGVCAAIGEAEYRLRVGIPAMLDELYERAKALNLEANEAAKAAKETKPNG